MARVDGIELLCPATGLTIGGMKIIEHFLPVYRCVNGALTIYCRMHDARVFMSDPVFVDQILESYNGSSKEGQGRDGRSRPAGR